MKNKSGRHKDTNTFKFQPFAERISNIDVDIFHRVGHENENESDEKVCFFNHTLQKWNVLNLTQGFNAFRKEILGIITLPQLLHRKEQVVESLLKHLKLQDPLVLQPILELVVALANDLRKEFYPYYSRFLEQLIEILHTKDTEVLEWCFQCLAYIFKFLWRYLIKDVPTILKNVLPLLDSSKPEYVNNFAAESFAFVARKIKDRRTFMTVIIQLLEERPEVLPGVSRLLFEIVRGVSGQFHSCAEETLLFYFQSLSEEKLSKSVLFDLLEQILYNILQNISNNQLSLLWGTFIKSFDHLISEWKRDHLDSTASQIELVLRLTGQCIEYKDGRTLIVAEPIVDRVAQLIELNLSSKIMQTLTQIGAVLLLSHQIVLPQENSSRLTLKLLNIPDHNIRLDFIKNVIPSKSFEALILPSFLDYCISAQLNIQVLEILVKLITFKSPLCLNATMLNQWQPYILDFPVAKQISLEFDVTEKLLSIIDAKNIDNVYEISSAAICIPHVKNIIKSKAIEHITDFIQIVCSEIHDREDVHKLLFVLFISVETLSHISVDKAMDNVYEHILKTVTPYCTNHNFICALRIVDLMTSTCTNSVLTESLLETLYTLLAPNLSSPFHEVRYLSLHIFSLFENLSALNVNQSGDEDKWRIFGICFNVESIAPTVHTYRDQLQYLSHLSYDKPQVFFYKNTRYKEFPLRYTLGVLYMNFQLLWDPVRTIISTHAHGLSTDDFWSIFYNQLQTAIQSVKKPHKIESGSLDSQSDTLNELYTSACVMTDKPDYANYRLLLWKAMEEFSNIVYLKNRDVVPLLLDFVRNEFILSNAELANTWSIKKNKRQEPEQMDVNEDLDNENDCVELTTIKQSFTFKISGKVLLKTLLTHLSVFSKMQNPKNIYLEPDLYKLYLDLLMNKNSDVQKVALDCIMNYRHKFLTPYKENLYNLIDDKRFKNELALFRIDSESEVLQKEHRKDFIPIVLRIVYSKMIMKTGLRTGGKAGGQLRRSLVMRFLAGCREDEVMLFAKMAFKIYASQIQENPMDIIISIESSIDLEHIIPPKRLQSSVNLLMVILEKFGGIGSKELLPYLLKVLFCVGAYVKAAFDKQEDVHIGYLSSLRQVRTSCIQTVGRFFDHFETYSWTEMEIDSIFKICVWPWLEKLPIEGIHSPTALMKLFMYWSQNPRYFVLLVKHSPNDPERYALPYIMKLLLGPKTHVSVVNACMEIIERLLTLQLDEEDMNETPIPAGEIVKSNKLYLEKFTGHIRINYGSMILLPHVPDILERLKRKISNVNKTVNKRELLILSHISELVWEPETSDNLLKLLLPILVKKASVGGGEETIGQLVLTLCNLIQNVPEPQNHIQYVASLFSVVNDVAPRKLLCSFLKTIADKCTDQNRDRLEKIANVITGLNAWDAKWVEQPDFSQRLAAFKIVNTMIEGDEIDSDLGVLIIHNCFYFLRNENDLSLRDSSTHCLRLVSSYLANKYVNSKVKDFIISDTLLNLIRTGIKDKNDRVRNESIALLGHLARESSTTHTVLGDLAKFTNKIDMEVDFFENLQHLQLHRHARALLKFCQISKNLPKMLSPRTLTQFVLPLATQYLCCDKYANKNAVIDAAIEVVGTVCKMLPWHQYETILRYYLGKLRYKVEFQKQLVRLIVAILDSFHFDLSKATNITLPPLILNDETAEKQQTDKTPETSTEEVPTVPTDGECVKNEEENDLESLLEKEDTTNLIMEEIVETKIDVSNYKALEKQTVLAPSAAKRLIFSITTGLLPQLHRTIVQMTQHEGSHKLNRKRTGAEREEEELLRVPIALALIKLLQKLPPGMLEQNLPGIFMKLCTFLKSHMDSVRRATREILQKIMLTLGPKYLFTLLDELAPLMTRGFQVHVLVYTVHSVLSSLKELYQPGDIDHCLQTILQLCNADIFGAAADEKEVTQIVSKVSEAKSTKSYDTFHILAQFVTEKCLSDLIMPLKIVLNKSNSHKKHRKVEECLRQIVLGLVDNPFISPEAILVFAYGTSSQSIPEFQFKVTKPILTEDEKRKEERYQNDCYLIPAEPKNRFGEVRTQARQNANANAHILVEFGLKLCYFVLKREKLKDGDFRPYLDPFIVVLLECLKSQRVKLCTLTLQCMCWMFKIDLPSMKENVKEFATTMFSLLHKYAAAGLSKGDNFDLVMAAFKAMSVLVRDAKYFVLSMEQLKALLLYAEQDLYDYDRQATAFNLLKAIICRKLVSPEMHAVMEKVAKISITSEQSNVRLQARQVFLQYIMDYPLGKKLEKHIMFYLSQLSYELQHGRESALDMILQMIQSFPLDILTTHCGVIFINLGARLVNDDAPECKKAVANCLKAMLTKIESNDRDKLFDIITVWLLDKKLSHRRLAAQLCGLIVTVESVKFEKRLSKLTPILISQFAPNMNDPDEPGRFVRIQVVKDCDTIEENQDERMKDHHLFQVLQLMLKISALCPTFLQQTEDIETLGLYAQSLLAYPHQWVRLAAAQFIGYVMTVLNAEHIYELLINNKCEPGFLSNNPKEAIKSLTLDLCAQLQVGCESVNLAEQVVKNLVFIARILKYIPFAANDAKKDDLNDEAPNEKLINLLWLTRRMRKVVNAEVAQTPTVIVLRQAVFQWIGGVSQMVDDEQLNQLLYHLMAPLVRELSIEEYNKALKQLAKQVTNQIKNRVGMDVYTAILSKLQMRLNMRRAERKKERAQMVITDPEIAAKRKIKLQEKKKNLKKRKMADMKGSKFNNKKRRKYVDLEEQ